MIGPPREAEAQPGPDSRGIDLWNVVSFSPATVPDGDISGAFVRIATYAGSMVGSEADTVSSIVR